MIQQKGYQGSDGNYYQTEADARMLNANARAHYDLTGDMMDSTFKAAEVGLQVGGAILVGRMGKAQKLYVEGLDLYEAGDLDGALNKFDAAIGKSKMASGIAFAMKGYVYYKKGDNEKALAAYNKGVNSNAVSKEYIHAFRSELYAKMGDTAKATADCCEAITGCYTEAYNPMKDGSIRDFLNLRGDISGFEQRCFPLLKAAAEGGNKYAYGALAECYDQGYGTAQNEQEAMKWFEKAAQVGYINGMAKTNKSKAGMLFRALFYTKAHIIVTILMMIILGIPTLGIGAVAALILGSIYSRRIVKKLIPGYTGMRSLKR